MEQKFICGCKMREFSHKKKTASPVHSEAPPGLEVMVDEAFNGRKSKARQMSEGQKWKWFMAAEPPPSHLSDGHVVLQVAVILQKNKTRRQQRRLNKEAQPYHPAAVTSSEHGK